VPKAVPVLLSSRTVTWMKSCSPAVIATRSGSATLKPATGLSAAIVLARAIGPAGAVTTGASLVGVT